MREYKVEFHDGASDMFTNVIACDRRSARTDVPAFAVECDCRHGVDGGANTPMTEIVGSVSDGTVLCEDMGFLSPRMASHSLSI